MENKKIIIFGALFIILTVCFFFIRNKNLYGDEYPHFQQIDVFLSGELKIVKGLSKLPGYHLAIAGISKLIGIKNISAVRTVSFTFSLLSILVFYNLAKLTDREGAIIKTLQYAFLPVQLPYFFLFYSEGLSNLMLFLLFYLVLKKNYLWAGIAGGLAVFIRQTNIVFLLMFMILGYWEEYGLTTGKEKIITFLSKTKIFLAVIILFGVFVYLNNGVALRDQEAMPSFQVHAGSIYWSLFLVFILFLPLHLANFGKIAKKIAANPLIFIPLILFFAAGPVFFDNLHPMNTPREHLGNRILLLYASDGWKRTAFFIFISYSVLSLSVTKLLKKSYYLLYPFAVLSVLPLWLIVSRYSLPSIILFLLLRKRESRLTEYSVLAIFAVLSLLIYAGFLKRDFYL